MKRFLKRALILSFAAALALIAFRFASRRRAGSSQGLPPWTPPPHVEVHPPGPPPAAPDQPTDGLRPPVEMPQPGEPAETAPADNQADWAELPPVDSPAPSHLHVVEPEELRLSAVEPGPAVDARPADEPDFLTTYFEEMAAAPDEDLVGRLAGMAEPGLEPVPEAAPDTAWPPEPIAPPEPPLLEGQGPPESSAVTQQEEEQRSPGPSAPQPGAALSESPEQALADLSPAPIVPPPRRMAESYLDEGNVYFNVSQYSLAIERYTTAIEIDPGLVAAYYNRANARTRAADFEGALSDYNRALELQPFDSDALNNRGMLHLYRSNYEEALRDFNAALAIDPADATVRVNRGLAHLHSGDAPAALIDFQEAATIDAEDAAAHYGAAQAAAVLGNRDEALRRIGRALELNPAYAREAAADPNLAALQGDAAFLKLLRDSGSRQS